jgi:hypothetical protein
MPNRGHSLTIDHGWQEVVLRRDEAPSTGFRACSGEGALRLGDLHSVRFERDAVGIGAAAHAGVERGRRRSTCSRAGRQPRSASSADRSRPLSDRRSAPARRLYEAIQAAVPDRTTQFAPDDIPAHSRRRGLTALAGGRAPRTRGEPTPRVPRRPSTDRVVSGVGAAASREVRRRFVQDARLVTSDAL